MMDGWLLSELAVSQVCVTTSSGESEYYSGCAGVAESILINTCLGFFGVVIRIAWHADSTVALAISERSGVGRFKHLAVRALWLQGLVSSDEVIPTKQPTHTNPADLNTKVHGPSRFLLSTDGRAAEYLSSSASEGLNEQDHCCRSGNESAICFYACEI